MNLKEIMMTVNSDITNPLNNLINDLSDEEVTLLNSIISKLDNTTYGLSAIKTMLSTVNTNAAYAKTNNTLLNNTTYGLSAIKTLIDGINSKVGSSASGGNSYPNVTTGKLSSVIPSLSVTGRGKATLYTVGHYLEMTPSIILDGVSLVDKSLLFYSMNSTGRMVDSPKVFTLTFESSLTVYGNIETDGINLYYILQTA
jgi:hypothetical protein